MTAKILDGKSLAATTRAALKHKVDALVQRGVRPGLTVIIAGDDPASKVYVRNKTLAAKEIGVRSELIELPASVTQEELMSRISQLNADAAVHGILVQLPLPRQIDANAILWAVSPDKDVDGFHPVNAGKLACGLDAVVPCTPLGCLLLIRAIRPDLAGARALVVGRSNIVGKPMAQLLLREHCTVTIAHSRTRDLAGECARADILVAAIGRPRALDGQSIKPGAIVIDVGINREREASGKDRVVGDVDFASALGRAGAITPVPGGVGPMTIACLLLNTLNAAGRSAGLDPQLQLDPLRAD